MARLRVSLRAAFAVLACACLAGFHPDALSVPVAVLANVPPGCGILGQVPCDGSGCSGDLVATPGTATDPAACTPCGAMGQSPCASTLPPLDLRRPVRQQMDGCYAADCASQATRFLKCRIRSRAVAAAREAARLSSQTLHAACLRSVECAYVSTFENSVNGR